jgi:hypothetical protein
MCFYFSTPLWTCAFIRRCAFIKIGFISAFIFQPLCRGVRLLEGVRLIEGVLLLEDLREMLLCYLVLIFFPLTATEDVLQ